MRKQSWRQRGAALALALGIALGMTACTLKGSDMDAAGHTRAQAEQLSLEQQFNQLSEHYERVHQLLHEAQLQVAGPDVEWSWISHGLAPSQGGSAPEPLPGGNSSNSYFLDVRSAIQLPGAIGGRSRLDPMIAYVEQQGWQVEVTGEEGSSWRVLAVTDDGIRLRFTVQESGQVSLAIFSRAYWGDTDALVFAVVYRVPKEQRGIQHSLPGEYTKFPEWSDPVVEPVR